MGSETVTCLCHNWQNPMAHSGLNGRSLLQTMSTMPGNEARSPPCFQAGDWGVSLLEGKAVPSQGSLQEEKWRERRERERERERERVRERERERVKE